MIRTKLRRGVHFILSFFIFGEKSDLLVLQGAARRSLPPVLVGLNAPLDRTTREPDFPALDQIT